MTRAERRAAGALRGALVAGLLVAGAGCAGARGEVVLDVVDPSGDVRLTVPRSPDVTAATFDLEHLTIVDTPEGWELTATFANPVPLVRDVRAARDVIVAMYPQTIDVYLDTTGDGHGHIEALPGRGFRVPVSQGWEQVLVVSSLDDLSEDGVVHPTRLSASGRRLVALFPKGAIPARPKGLLAIVLATSPAGDGRVRPIGRGGDCQVWDDSRCTLGGDGPPVLDAVGPVAPGRPLALTYLEGPPPAPAGLPVVFARGPLVGVAPITPDITKGRLATLVDASGAPLGTAMVTSIVGDTATLEVIGGASGEGATSAVFAASEDR